MQLLLDFSVLSVMQVTVAETSDRDETSLVELTCVVEDPYHTATCSRSKGSITAGTGAFNGEMAQQRWDPHLEFGQGSWCLYAQAGPWGRLKA